MVTRSTKQTSSMADLLESAVAAAHPDRVSAKLADYRDYRLPLDRLSGEDNGPDAAKGIRWSAALKAAYEDGYDPLMWIGRGASSEVWRCVDRSFGREVAIKVPFHEISKDTDTVVAALQSEAELLGRLHHPGIVHAVRRSGEGQAAYMAIDFVDGENLIEHSRLMKLDRLSRLRLFSKVLDAVAYLHAKDIVHGDLKPEHILVRENNQPVLIDFGLSSSESLPSLRLSDPRRVGGSGSFRAPEIASGSAVSPEPQQDVYSLGVILRELLGEPEEDEVGLAIHAVIQRAMQPDPAKRWESAGDLLNELRPLLTRGRVDGVDATASPSEPAPQRRLVFRWVASFGLLSAILILGAFALAQRPEAAGSPNGQSEPSSSGQPIVKASLFDLALQDIYAGKQSSSQQHLDQIAELAPEQSEAWEMRHLAAMMDGRGEAHPLGHLPYNAAYARCADYDPTSETMAYVTRGEGNCELWIRPINGPARQIANSVEVVLAIALSPGGDRVASVDIDGRVMLWTIQEGDAPILRSHELPRQVDGRILWFGAEGNTLFLFSPRQRALECWSIENPLPAGPSFVISDCDHAYRLPSGEGAFMVATAGANAASGQTQLRLINPQGEMIRLLELEDGQLPACADSGPGQNATVCLGMTNGYVRIHQAENGGWQQPCDLGLNSAVPAVVYSAREQRAYASLGRIHVIASDGRLVMRLGDRDASQQLVTRLDFDETTATLTCLSIREFWRCLAD